MDDGIRCRFEGLVLTILAGAWRWDGQGEFREKVLRKIRDVVDLIDEHGGEWTDQVDARLTKSLFDARPHPAAVLAVQQWSVARTFMRHAWAIIHDRQHLIPAQDREVLSELLGEELVPASSCPPPAEENPRGPVPVRFRYVMLARERGLQVMDGYGLGSMMPAEACDAPVVASLSTRAGGNVELRRGVDGSWLRPVLAAGSWRPATVREFIRAAESGEPWADNPYSCARKSDGARVVHMSEVVHPSARRSRDVEDRAARHVRALVAQAGILHAIDGIVHRTCPEPALIVVGHAGRDDGGGRMVALSWSTEDGLTGASDQHHLRPGNALNVVYGTHDVRRWFPFRIGEEEAARLLLHNNVRRANQDRGVGNRIRTDHAGPVVELRNLVPTSDTDRLLRHVSRWPAPNRVWGEKVQDVLSELSGDLTRGRHPAPERLTEMSMWIDRTVAATGGGDGYRDMVIGLVALLSTAAAMVERDRRLELDVEPDFAGLSL